MSVKVEVISGEPAGIPLNAERIYLRIDGELHQALLSRDEVPPGNESRWHISLSKAEHLEDPDCHDVPTWRDLVAVVHQLRPGVTFAVGIPPRNMWMNHNPNVLHAWEIRDPGLEEAFRVNAEAVKGTPAADPS